MQWLWCTAFLLFVAWSCPSQAVRISALQAEQRLPQKQAKIGSRNHPVEYVLLPSARGGYTRRNVHSLGKADTTSTTERPLVRVWNSFVRSVQPAFSFRNLTNPLANFFNDGSANIIETSPVYLEAYNDDQELQLEEPTPVASQSSNKRKRKRRKQQKRRPVYDSQENDDDYGSYDHYYAPPPPPPPSAQPMFFYDTNSGNYYGVQRFSPQDFQARFYSFNGQQQREPEDNDSEPETASPVLRRLGPRKVTLLRPLAVSSVKSQSPPKAEVSRPESTNKNEETVEENDSSTPSDATINDEDDGDIETHSPLSESMRNALGTYMRDDLHTRERQRLASDGADAHDSDAKVSPRHYQRRLFRLGAW
ncbi:uncharacterized protein LOC108047865 [Drosophila rhopaloa]|uniref:Uncharacterized protein n=1 Tax=Drosophila rhopaloa TaxID=1041015 RepID=A0ABM5HQ77_DRORH|nr:uncharacterized protein LOC108047865 [Drosophila rhopaloa]